MMMDLAEGTAELTRAQHAQKMIEFGQRGAERARAIGNRGPVRLDENGRLHPDILAAYWKHGYYVFEGVISPEEVEELRREAGEMLQRAPIAPGAKVDAQGRPTLGADAPREIYNLCKPLSDPQGGTEANAGRHPSRMAEPKPDGDAPNYTVLRMRAMCQYMPAGLRVYGHPHLLAIAASINGEDFVPAHLHHLRLSSPQVRAGFEIRAQHGVPGRDLRRGAYRSTLRRHRRGDRCAPAALSAGEAVRLPALRRARRRLQVQRGDVREGRPQLQPL
ncbi:MAG: hypothetical protein GEV05_30285 [Betaproteobacteria bacterium]|nr:hypothetical protein [Betaproteobacteria bacterium]